MISKQPKSIKKSKSVNQTTLEKVSKTQYEFVLFQIQNLQELMQRADSKAQFILGADTVLFSVIVILFPDIRNIFLTGEVVITLIYGALLLFFTATTLVSMVIAFLVVYPVYSPLSQEKPQNIIYFREIARFHDVEVYKKALFDSSLQDILKSASSEIYWMSIGACKKYSFLRKSMTWLIAGVILWALTLSVTLVFPF